MRLREIGRRDDRIPEVFIDGIYGKETQNAVRELQKIYSLRVTGAIDLETIELINRLYEDILRRERIDGYRPKFDNYEGQVMSPDDVFDDVFLLQLLLRELSLKDDRFFVEIDGRFNPQTVIAVKLLQSILGKEQDGKVDRELWNSLVRLTETTEGYL
jgi:peptidoglycan hydrolase-like protein with peptidoglycan-binding domain